MAAKEEAEVGAGAAPTVVGLALGGSKSSAYVLPWALATFAKDDAPPAFKLIHVLTPVLAEPTPMGHLLPIDEASTNVAEGHLQKMWIEKQEMPRRCKDTCDENKVEAQVLLVEGKDVADTISSLVSQYQIQFLVVGNHSSNSPFTRRSSASRTTCKICKSVPSFCTAYVVSEDGSSSVYASESESGLPSGSLVPTGNSGSSNTKEFTDGTSSRSAGQNSDKGNLALLKRRKIVAKKSRIQLQHVSILEDIFVRVTKSDLNRVTACSTLFLRVALSPCICIGSRAEPRLVAILVESKSGFLRAAVPVGTSTPWLESAARMLNNFLALSSQSHGWIKAVGCRDGLLALIKDSRASVVQVIRPFDSLSITTLPDTPVSSNAADELVTAAIVAMAGKHFSLYLLCRGQVQQLCIKIFSSVRGWQVIEISCPFMLSPTRMLKRVRVYVSGKHHLLDPISKMVLVFDIKKHLLDAVPLPTDEMKEKVSLRNNVLACSGGELYWVMLEGSSVIFFLLTGSKWTLSWRRTIPEHIVPDELLGHAELTGIVILKRAQQLYGMKIENGAIINFKGNTASVTNSFPLEISHIMADHVLPDPQ